MTLPASGAISIGDIATEFGFAQTNISFSSLYRANGYTSGAVAANGVANLSSNFAIPQGGQISLDQFYSTSKGFIFVKTISSTTADYIIGSDAATSGWDSVSPIDATITLASGIYIYGSSTSTAAMRDMASSAAPTGSLFRIIVPSTSVISGKGGNGGGGNGGTGGTGGPGLTVYTPNVLVDNLGTIAGGGGGGGGGAGGTGNDGGEGTATYGGGGGGGGAGYSGGSGGGGAGGNYPGGSGSSGSWNAAGGGGSGGSLNASHFAGAGGGGGSAGSSGNSGSGASGDISASPGGGGSGGAAASGSGSISWINTGTRYGSSI